VTRVVSLVPSVTETLLAWGIEPIACTRFCEQPAIPHVGGTKDPDLDAVVALRPDLVVVDEEENRREDADALATAGVAVHALAIRSVDDVVSQLDALAERLGVPPPLRLRAGTARQAAPSRRATAFVPIWRRPWMALGSGTYGSDLLARLGLRNVVADRYATLDDLDGVRADVVVAPSEPYPFGERHVAELERAGPVVLVDGKDLFWWGVRTPAALERLRAQLDPGAG
jgi:ABC-type hemin transport system substrate-binding protein